VTFNADGTIGQAQSNELKSTSSSTGLEIYNEQAQILQPLPHFCLTQNSFTHQPIGHGSRSAVSICLPLATLLPRCLKSTGLNHTRAFASFHPGGFTQPRYSFFLSHVKLGDIANGCKVSLNKLKVCNAGAMRLRASMACQIMGLKVNSLWPLILVPYWPCPIS